MKLRNGEREGREEGRVNGRRNKGWKWTLPGIET